MHHDVGGVGDQTKAGAGPESQRALSQYTVFSALKDGWLILFQDASILI